MPFDGFFAWCDDGFETQFSSMRVSTRLVFPYRVLSDLEA